MAPLVEANGAAPWTSLDDAERRTEVLRICDRQPLLWIWDNVEPVAGYPVGAPSAWTDAEQEELAAFLRDLGETRATTVLTSRRDERGWLGSLPARVALQGMPMRERVQLIQAIARHHGTPVGDLAGWLPLLRVHGGQSADDQSPGRSRAARGTDEPA